jgi:hypothetical protein
MSEFLLRPSNLSLTKLKQLDTNLRTLINHKIGLLPLIKEIFDLRARNGGFNIESLYDRYHMCEIANLGHFRGRSIGGAM